MKKVRLSILHRKPRKNANFSIESYYQGIYERLPKDIEATFYHSKYESNGLWKRIYNIFEAAFRQGDVNHVTGDVHFLTYLLSRKKTILTVLDCGGLSLPLTAKMKVFLWLWFALPARKAKLITVISQATKDDLLRYLPWLNPDIIHVVPVFVDAQYTPLAKTFNAENPTLLQIGTKPNKNLPRLIEAISGIACTLWIVGKLSDEYRELLTKYNITYENFVGVPNEELLALYQKCDIVTFVSTLEGFGMPIVEANLVGRAVITANVTSMPEVGGDAVCLADPYDVASIRTGILRLMQDSEYREQLIQNGYKNAQRYNPDTIVSQYVTLYHQIAQQ